MSGRGGTAPAFMLYAADLLADKRFRLASLAERGLLLTLLCECWTNNFVPADGADLARYLGIDFEALRAAATERVLSHFAIRETDEGRELFSPGLEKYRQRIEAIRAAQSAGGKKSTSRYSTDKRKRPKPSNGAVLKATSHLQVMEPEPESEPEPERERKSKALVEAKDVDARARAYRLATGR